VPSLPAPLRPADAAHCHLSEELARAPRSLVADEKRDLRPQTSVIDAVGPTLRRAYRVSAQPAIGKRLGFAASAKVVREMMDQFVEVFRAQLQRARVTQEQRGR
jgi:hypothetical protein